MKLVLYANTAWYLHNFRYGLIRALLEQGSEVVVMAPTGKAVKSLESMGAQFIPMEMDNKGSNPARDFSLSIRSYRALRNIRPDVVLNFTIKPVIYGTLAAKLLGIPCINTITGLGTAFIKESWITKVVGVLYRMSLPLSHRVFFQNPDDRQLFLDRRYLSADLIRVVPGSGINLSRFSPSAQAPGETLRFLLIARMLRDKGVVEYVDAARILKERGLKAEFQLLGPIGVDNRTALSAEQLRAWEDEGLIRYLGAAEDVRPHIAKADCVVLPSYREGTPRTLLEASAMAKPLVATDVVGCREVVKHGENGFLCKVRDADSLAAAIVRFAELSSQEKLEMGVAARRRVELFYDEKIVIGMYQQAMREL